MPLLIDFNDRVPSFQQHMREERLNPVPELAVADAGTQRVKYRLNIEAVPIPVQK
jgi:hypothetical protein